MTRILVAVDLGDDSDRVIRYALRMAGADAEIVLAHVVCDLEALLDPYVCRKPLSQLQADLVIEGKARLQRLARELFEGRPAPRELLLSGTAWSELVSTALRHGVDAIVIGAQTSGSEGDRMVGGTVARVLWHAPCAVVVVPPEQP